MIGKIGVSLFFAAFAAAGCFFLVMIGGEVVREARTYGWAAVPCTIVRSGIEQDQGRNDPFTFTVRYRYSFGGRERTSDRYTQKIARFSDYAEAQRLVQRYAAGSGATCYVNPDDAQQAVLAHESVWEGLFILLPLVFVAVGFGGIYFTWRRRAKASGGDEDDVPIVSRKAGRWGRFGAVGFFGVFAAFGVGFAWPLLVMPVTRTIDARNWPTVPCVVESSQLRSHSSDDGTTYSIDILYRYTFDGKKYKSNRYNFMTGSSSGRNGKQKIIRQYPRGKKAVCYVNPDDPTQAVLMRGLSWMLLLGLLPLAFCAIGFGGIYFTLRGSRKKPSELTCTIGERRTAAATAGDAGDDGDLDFLPKYKHADGPVTLKPTHSRFGKLFGILFFAVFWNGIVSVFVYHAIESHRSGHPDWFLTLFMIPFVLVGLGVIGGVFYFLLALFNPRAQVTVNRNVISPGESLDVAWDIIGRTQMIHRLHVCLEAREQATYRRGTNTVTDKNVFATFDLIDTDNPVEIVSGAGSVTIPDRAMHSFVASNNKIIWTLHFKGEIARWPDVNLEFLVVILPKQVRP